MHVYRPKFGPDRGLFASAAPNGGGDPGAGGGAPPAPPPPAPGTPATPAPDWRLSIPEPIRTEPYFKDIADVGDLASKAFNQAKLIGVAPDQMIRLASPDDKEAWNGIWNRLGRPESADKYQLADPKEIPEGLDLSAEGKTAFGAKAHELGLSQRQADALYQWINDGRIGSYTAAVDGIKQSIAAVDAQLKTQWGAAYAQKSGDLNLVIDHLSRQFNLGTRLREAIDMTGGENGVAVRQALAEVGALMRDHDLIKGDGAGSPGGAMTPTQAQQEINAMYGDAETGKALRDQRHPGHADAVAKMNRLYGFAYPDAA